MGVTRVGRADAGEFARRVNTAVDLLREGIPVAQAARVLAARYGVSARQCRRYADHAAGGRVPAPEATTVFTVKLPVSVAARVRAHAAGAGVTISAVVTQALTEHLRRGSRQPSPR